jgi:hypothetical protein
MTASATVPSFGALARHLLFFCVCDKQGELSEVCAVGVGVRGVLNK